MSTRTGRYSLIDTESANVLGCYDSEADALRDVLDEVDAFGPDAPEVLSLALIRLDVPREQGHIAAGRALVARAMGRTATAGQMRLP